MNTDFTLGNYLFRSVKLINDAAIEKCKYTGYCIELESCSEFLFTDRNYGRNVIIFGPDMNSSVHADSKGNDILILGEGPTQGLCDTTLIAEAKYPINLYIIRKKSTL